jgi:hypothetical protein
MKPCTKCGKPKRRAGDSKCGPCRDALDEQTAERIRKSPLLRSMYEEEVLRIVGETGIPRADLLYLGASSRGKAAEARRLLARRLWGRGLSKRATAIVMGVSEMVVLRATKGLVTT